MGLFSLFSKKSQETGDDHEVPVKPRRSRAAKSQDDEPMDPMLPEKKRARRRLIGAIALVLAAIIGLPMIFDSEPKPLSDDIDIQIPSRDKTTPAASRPMPLPPEPVAGDPKSDPVADPLTSKPAADASAADSKSDTKAAVAAPAGAAVVTPAAPAAENKLPAPANPVPIKPVPPKADAGTRAGAAAATDKLAETIAEKTRNRFVVQVAAVSSQAKAEELQNRLKKAGIQSYSQRVSTKDGDRFRIRIGPFGNREEADKMRGRLGPLGLSGTVQPV